MYHIIVTLWKEEDIEHLPKTCRFGFKDLKEVEAEFANNAMLRMYDRAGRVRVVSVEEGAYE